MFEILKAEMSDMSRPSSNVDGHIIDQDDLEDFYINKLEKMRDEGRQLGDNLIEERIQKDMQMS